ncbi:Transcription initiation factor IIF subunit alpha [Hyphodiscus hymeniophilus]|uniref:Transcription initiation factor IIF subunit alpha n=1 Tax=Hyphodiscus hymeniophilus TaxID=353542 RepID=A0A9P6VN22_9HELO|nr:Transcription initiation factor IIF subunit alpha [Hyphodiscus hymeniophilus]
MSASPSGLSNGQTPTPNGGPPQFVRKAKPVDPLRPRKKPVRRTNMPSGASGAKPNGFMPNAGPSSQAPQNGSFGGPPRPLPSNGANQSYGDWSRPPLGEYHDYPLFTTKRALREGLRYHIAKFNGKKDVDPSNADEFTRPVLLSRRDPRAPSIRDGKEEEANADEVMDSREREKAEIAKAEKDARRAADLAQIAPTGNNAAAAAKKGHLTRQPKTTQVWKTDKTAEDKKKSDLRYEESLPWHVEDADGKNAWVGTYEAALSDVNVVFVVEGSSFKMIPVDKWYKFTQKAQFKTLTIEEVEAQLAKGAKETRWAMKTHEKVKAERADAVNRNAMYGSLFQAKRESTTFKNSSKRETEDADDLDFDADDLFQDDDEQATMELDQDQDAKEAQDRIKREQLGANIFDKAVEAEVDQELAKEQKEEEKRKLLGKGVTKALKKREKNYIYDSDGSSNPYESSSSDDDTSDEEKQMAIDKRKDEEAKAKAKMESSKLPSGASSKGTNTPSGRPKHSDPLKKHKNLKRSGSPGLSESSGNESSRKKLKKRHASSQPTGTSTPIPGSRPMSPVPSASQPLPDTGNRKRSIVKLTVASSKLSEISSAPPNPSPVQGNAMSDGEATAGEMSDANRPKKIKIKFGTPSGSRAGSPAPTRAGHIGAGGSRAGSPAAQGAARSQSPQSSGLIQAHEISAALPPEGITIGNLFKKFESRIGDAPGQTTRKVFFNLIKVNSFYDQKDVKKLLKPLPPK